MAVNVSMDFPSLEFSPYKIENCGHSFVDIAADVLDWM
jgi:hypothetical protein